MPQATLYTAVQAYGSKVTIGGQVYDPGTGNGTIVLSLDSTGAVRWSRFYFDDFGTQGPYPLGIAVDSAGNVAVAGSWSGSVDFGPGSASSTNPAAFLVKLDPMGNTLFAKRYQASTYAILNGLAFDAQGDLYCSGLFAGTANFGSGFATSSTADQFVLALDANGSFRWWTSIGDGNVEGPLLAVDDVAGDLILAGTYKGTISLGATTLTSNNPSGGTGDVYWAKLTTANGVGEWLHGAGNNSDQSIGALRLTSAGGFVVAGRTVGAFDFGGAVVSSDGIFAASFDTLGTPIWALALGTDQNTGSANLSGGSTTQAGDLVLTGLVGGTVTFPGGPITATTNGGSTMFLVDVASDGTFAKQTSYDRANSASIAIAPDGDLLLGGTFVQGLDFGVPGSPAALAYGPFVAKIPPL